MPYPTVSSQSRDVLTLYNDEHEEEFTGHHRDRETTLEHYRQRNGMRDDARQHHARNDESGSGEESWFGGHDEEDDDDEGDDGILFSVFQSATTHHSHEGGHVSSSTVVETEASGQESDVPQLVECGIGKSFFAGNMGEQHAALFDSLSEASTVSLERQQGLYHEEIERKLENLLQEMFDGVRSTDKVRAAHELLDREGVVEYNVYRPPRGAHLQPRLHAMHLTEWGEERAAQGSLFVAGSRLLDTQVSPSEATSEQPLISRKNGNRLVHPNLNIDLSVIGNSIPIPLRGAVVEESPYGGTVEEVLAQDGAEEDEMLAFHDGTKSEPQEAGPVKELNGPVRDAQRLSRGFPPLSPNTMAQEEEREADVIRVWETICIPAIRERWDHLRRVAVVRGGSMKKALTAFVPLMSALLGEEVEPRDCRAPRTPPPLSGTRSHHGRSQRMKEKTPKKAKDGRGQVAHPPLSHTKENPPVRQRKVSSLVDRFSCYMEPQLGHSAQDRRSRSLEGGKERSRTQSPPPVPPPPPSGPTDMEHQQPLEKGDHHHSTLLPGIHGQGRRRQAPTVRVMPNLAEAPPPMRGSGAIALLNRAQTALVRPTLQQQPSQSRSRQ